MSRKHSVGLFALVLLASACASAGPGGPDTKRQWIPEAVDTLSDTGRSPSMVVDPDGLPHLAYLGLNEQLAEGEIAPARPLTLPIIPAVLTTDATKSGVWNHGAVVSTSNVADPLPLKKTDVVAIGQDADGNRAVAFTEKGDLQYSAESGGSYGSPEKIAHGTFTGLSLTLDAKGNPWVAWLQGGSLKVATSGGKSWSVQTVGHASQSQRFPATTSIKAGPDGPVVAFSGPGGSGPELATQGGGGWNIQQINRGGGGFGISLALDGDGNPHVAYYTARGEVRHAHSIAGSPWEITPIAHAGTAHPAGWSASIALDKKGTHYIAWYDTRRDEVRLATNASGDFEQIPVTGTEQGELPQVGVAPDGSTVYVAWYDHVNADLYVGLYGVNGPPEVALAMVSPTAAPTAAPGPSGGCDKSDNVTITAPKGAAATGFKETSVTAKAGQITMCFTNDDDGVAHNVAVFSADPLKDTSAKTLFTGDIITGAATADYDVGSLPAGSYFYHCDVHPTTMDGTLTVK